MLVEQFVHITLLLMKSEVFPWRHVALLGTVAACLVASVTTAAPAPTPRPAASASPSPAPTPTPSPTPTPPPALPLAEIAPQAQETLAKLKGIEPESAADEAVKTMRNALGGLEKEIDDLRDRTSRASENVGSSLDNLRNLQLDWARLETTLTEQSASLGGDGRKIDEETREVDGIKATWTATRDAPKSPDAPAETLDQVSRVLYEALVTQTRLTVRQNRVLELQNRVGTLLGRIDDGQAIVEQALASAMKTLYVRESPPLWATEAQPAPGLPERGRAAYSEQVDRFNEYVASHATVFAAQGVIFLVLLVMFLWLRGVVHQWTEDEPHLKRAAPIFDVPIAAALVLSFLVMGGRYAGAPGFVHAAVSILALLPTVVLLRRLLAPRLYVVLWALVVFTVLDQVRVAISALPTLARWLFCFEMAAAAGVFLFLFRLQRRPAGESSPVLRSKLRRWIPALFALAVTVFTGALGANALGYARLGTLYGTAALQSAYTAVFLYALLRVLDGLVVITLRVRPISASRIAQTHRDEVQAQVNAIFRLGALFLWLRYTLEQVQLYTVLSTGTVDLLSAEHKLGTISLSLGSLLGFALAIWLSLLISRVLRFFLSEEVYERVQLAPGLPYAISTILNYLILLVGFIIALGLLGVDLTKITIVAGAFSVGLGFGLQNIINNFVSGIILLFERPVKVGDVIQFGDSIGEVRRIGIRASIIRTREGSDIILPNGNLISNQVTNWTYADRRRAVEVSLAVALGPDPNHVIQLLKTAATKEPTTEDQPAPEVYITGITATGMNLVVRAWTHRYEDWIEARSELNVTLLAALARENIKLV